MSRFVGEYTDDWKEIATLVKDEAEWCCVRCTRYHSPSTGYCLTVHHFDGNKANMARWNLMALCQRCHLQVQAKADPRQPIMFDPSPWAMPYVAGVYEAGLCEPSPSYDLAKWIKIYTENQAKPWPHWGVRP